MRTALRLAALLASALASAALHAPLGAQRADTAARAFDFSIRNIMRGPELYGYPPQDVRWSADGRWIYFSWVPAGSDWRTPREPFRVRAVAGATPERLTPAEHDSAAPYLADGGARSPDRRYRAVSSGGDVYVMDEHTASIRRLTRTAEPETDPVFSADGQRVYYVRDNNVYGVDLGTGLTTQVTDLHTGEAPHDSAPANAQRARLEQQQRELFQAVRDHLHADSLAKADSIAEARRHAPAPAYLGRDRDIDEIHISPDGRTALVVLRKPGEGRRAQVPYWVNESGYVTTRNTRTKVGDFESRFEVVAVTLANGHATPLKLFPKDSLPSYVAVAGWNPAGTDAAFYAFAPDNKSRRLYDLASDGTLHLVEEHRDTAWVDGPCSVCVGWYDGGRRLWYVSEATGFAHLYTAAARGGDVHQLTSGHWEVRDVALSDDERDFYLTTNEPSPFEGQLYRLAVGGGARVRLTSRSGGHTAVVSPDGAQIADVYSYVNRPPDLYLMPNRPGAAETQLTRSPSDEWLRVPWIAPAIVMIPASDGARVPAHMYRPEDMGARPNGAAVIFVHGAGYLHNVGNFWSEYPREYLFNQFLARHGYVVLDADYRASDGYGRDWRTAIYRWMGGRDLQDEVDVSRWITRTYGIPPTRIGIYGGSYGGFMTLMALFTTPQFFGAGAALRSVTDWAHYNNGYTSNILNLPQNDTLAYRRSSPIYFAAGLRAPLLMAHGMVDTNVNFQDIVRLTQRLIELGKTGWELAPYPVEDHGFVRPSSWTDEYTRIFELFERSIGRPPS